MQSLPQPDNSIASDRMLQGIAVASNLLLTINDYDQSIQSALAALGPAINVDRIYIFENHPHPDTGEMATSQRWEWVAEGISVELDNPELQNIIYEESFPGWYETFSQHKPVFGTIHDFTEPLHSIMESQSILSLLLVPIFIQDHFWGFTGFDDCHSERRWDPRTLAVLMALAGSIGGAIAQRQSEAKLKQLNETLEYRVKVRTAELEQAKEAAESANQAKSELLAKMTQTLQELQATQEELIQSEKMAALGQLVAGIAHEINTPLGAIQASITNITAAMQATLNQLPLLLQQLSPDLQTSFLNLLAITQQSVPSLSSREERQLRRHLIQKLEEIDYADPEALADVLVEMGIRDIDSLHPLLEYPDQELVWEVARNLSNQFQNSENILLAVERASKIVHALRSYARQDPSGRPVLAHISDSIDIVLTIYQNQIKHGIEVIRDYHDVPPIYCYPDELNQVWTNLIHNAIHAMCGQGQLTIRVGVEAYMVCVQVIDTGTGIPPEIQHRIFDPFFTTKPIGEGTGLGLDIVRRIIAKHHGTITVDSRPGYTNFQVFLPTNLDVLEKGSC